LRPRSSLGEFLTAPANHAVKVDVILKRIGTCQIVVVPVDKADGDAAGLIHLAGHRLEACRDLDVAFNRRLVDRERKPVVGRIGIELREGAPSFGGRIVRHGPLARPALAGQRRLEVLWQ